MYVSSNLYLGEVYKPHMADTCSPSTQKAEAGRLSSQLVWAPNLVSKLGQMWCLTPIVPAPGSRNQPGLHSSVYTKQGCIVRLCLTTEREKDFLCYFMAYKSWLHL